MTSWLPGVQPSWILLTLCGCSWVLGAPVPTHGELGPALRQVLAGEPAEALHVHLQGDQALVSSMVERWSMTRESVEQLQGAQKPSQIASAWGALIPTCTNCHRGDPDPKGVGPGHGGAFDALLRGVRIADANLSIQAVTKLRDQPDLGPGQRRILQLADRIATHDQPQVQSKALASLMYECWRCHKQG